MRRGVLGLLVGVALGGAAQTTPWMNPSLDYGQFANGARAYFRDNLYAVGPHGAVHHYGGFGIVLPGEVEIVGIEVVLRARKDGAPNAYLEAELSWDGGMHWTTTGYQAGPYPGAWRQYIVGGPTDLWGRAWSPGEVQVGLRVRLRAVNAIQLDWVAVRVTYRASGAPTLSVTPEVVDLGTLTLAHYDAGWLEWAGVQRITVSSPRAWSLTVAAGSPTWLYTGPDAPPAKPCGHLEWRVRAAGPGVTDPRTSFTALSVAGDRVATGGAGTGLWLEIAFRLRVDYETTPPGTYELLFVYTLVAP
ncbi:MAG: hypothetical protein N2320_04695 [Candidatus Bipolaricaulota bacterium]|nr:hypothetical protein [Candidatus Bipolaricaulota bacterium]